MKRLIERRNGEIVGVSDLSDEEAILHKAKLLEANPDSEIEEIDTTLELAAKEAKKTERKNDISELKALKASDLSTSAKIAPMLLKMFKHLED